MERINTIWSSKSNIVQKTLKGKLLCCSNLPGVWFVPISPLFQIWRLDGTCTNFMYPSNCFSMNNWPFVGVLPVCHSRPDLFALVDLAGLLTPLCRSGSRAQPIYCQFLFGAEVVCVCGGDRWGGWGIHHWEKLFFLGMFLPGLEN